MLKCLKSMPNLLHLKVYEVELTTESLAQISQQLPDLKSVYLDLWVDDTDLNPFLLSANNLDYLAISTLYSALKEDVPINQMPQTLKYLQLSGDQEFYLLDKVSQDCKSLNSLVIYSQVTDQMIDFVGKLISLKNLEIGLLTDDQGSAESNYAQIFTHLNNLRALTLQEADQWITKSIADNCKQLELLIIQESISCKGASHLASLPKLTSLEISSLEGSPEDLEQFILQLSERGKLQHVWIENDDIRLPLNGLLHLIQNCKPLKSVHLYFEQDDLAYSRLCKLVDDISADSRDLMQILFKSIGEKEQKYKWLKFCTEISRPSLVNPWKYAELSDGIPAWA
uniref:Uncharacterized protein n=1 Tax=Ditylenchus dipsaci TaxID=166011 RepID=A0A915EHH7_9BILA